MIAPSAIGILALIAPAYAGLKNVTRPQAAAAIADVKVATSA